VRTVTRLALALAVLSAALAAGFFYAYACSVMIGLAAADPAAAVKAMQGINATVRNPVFAFAFFGPLAFGGGAALGAALRQEKGRRQTLLIASSVLLHAVGVLGVTFGFNVPLNQTLAAIFRLAATSIGRSCGIREGR
jgi:uncharacterized membrane protein